MITLDHYIIDLLNYRVKTINYKEQLAFEDHIMPIICNGFVQVAPKTIFNKGGNCNSH